MLQAHVIHVIFSHHPGTTISVVTRYLYFFLKWQPTSGSSFILSLDASKATQLYRNLGMISFIGISCQWKEKQEHNISCPKCTTLKFQILTNSTKWRKHRGFCSQNMCDELPTWDRYNGTKHYLQYSICNKIRCFIYQYPFPSIAMQLC
jgi:hypothetical protein